MPHPSKATDTNQSVTRVDHFPHPHAQFSLGQKLNPIWWFGNADEPNAPDWYHPSQPLRTFRWHIRNPFHNFTFYVIGIADKPFTRVGPYARQTGNPNGGWNWAVNRYKRLRLPFADYRRHGFEFYLGWRTGGNFGIKINFGQDQKPSKPATAEKKLASRALNTS
jgi:hypothetical protein